MGALGDGAFPTIDFDHATAVSSSSASVIPQCFASALASGLAARVDHLEIAERAGAVACCDAREAL